MNTYICNVTDNIITALQDTVVGMLMIFSVLAILWGCIELFRLILTSAQKKKDAKARKSTKAETAPAKAAEAKEKSKAEPAPQAELTDESEIVAAISVALAEYLNEPMSSFRVVSFRKVNNGAHWNK